MKKFIRIITIIIAFSLLSITLTGCFRITPNQRRTQDALDAQNRAQIAVTEAEYNAVRIQLDADAQLYYVQLEAERILLKAEAEAEVIRARGIADAMYIIQEYINEDYLVHFWIRTLGEHEGLIYVATEMGLPIFPGFAADSLNTTSAPIIEEDLEE